jgi:RHS repeat-associated protein
MLMPTRTWDNGSKYRYGFNGQEMDNEIAGEGNTCTAEFWEYDSRLGRRWNVDPVFKDYESPYATFGNNPIWFADPLGLDTTITNSNGSKSVYTGKNNENGGGIYNNVLETVVVKSTGPSINRPPTLDVNYTERINFDLKQLKIHPDQLKEKLNQLFGNGGSPDLKDLIKKLRGTEYGKVVGQMYDMGMNYQKGSNGDIPMPPQLAELMSVPVRYATDQLEEADAGMISHAHGAGYDELTTYLNSYNRRFARSQYGGGFVAFSVSKETAIMLLSNKAVVTAHMIRLAAKDQKNSTVGSYMLYMKKEQLSNPIIDKRNIGVIPISQKQ